MPLSFETVIGLEVHVQLATASKLFCSCPTKSAEPNSACCEICLGMPGSKPSINKKAIDYALMIALALDCRINKEFFFSRKTYFYPDMAKDFQITQYEVPLGEKGFLEVNGKRIGITRVHLEEDPASLVHEKGMRSSSYCLVDYNRSGIPLAEIVSDPDMRSPEEARAFLNELVKILKYLEVFIPGENVLKADANLSLEGGERVEIKNITGRKAIEDALFSEEKRQRSSTEKIKRETRAWDSESCSTYSLRSKETEADYGYIFEPDLTKFVVEKEWLEELKKKMPELHSQKSNKFVKQYGLDKYTADVLSNEKALGDLFEEVAKEADVNLAASFLTRELLAIANRAGKQVKELKLEAKELSSLVNLLSENKVSEKVAKQAAIIYVTKGTSPIDFIEKEGLLKDLDSSSLENAVKKVLEANKQAFKDLKKGEQKSMNFLVGAVMKETRGKADARKVQELIKGKIK